MKTLRRALVALGLYAAFVALHFPWATDDLKPPPVKLEPSQEFYDQAFRSPEQQQQESDYERLARRAARYYRVKEQVSAFVATAGLADKRVLEVGAGSGSLQDIVPDYTGLDLSATARRHFHKPFVQASATAMPFRDNEFDGLWTIWVVEHIPNPEVAMMEMRRVVKPGGYIFFMPAWHCVWWAREGLDVRPYSDLSAPWKVVKAFTPLLLNPFYRASYKLPINYIRRWTAARGPTRLRFQRITPNLDKYWQSDSDAVVSLDPYEAYLWFKTRGDHCLNCDPEPVPLLPSAALVIRVNKAGSQLAAR